MNKRLSFLSAVLAGCLLALTAPAIAHASCGDGVFEPPTEQCDDGNTTPGDGCDASCQIEAGYACALDIDFENLQHEEYPGTGSDAVWSDGFFSRTQTANTKEPTFAYWGGDAKAQTWEIDLSVTQNNYDTNDERGDDDFIGFALGFKPGDAADEHADQFYLLIDWKAAAQSNEPAGLKLNVVKGIPKQGSAANSDFWGKKWPRKKSSKVYHVANAIGFHQNKQLQPGYGSTTYGNTGWVNDGAVYHFEITYTDTQLTIWATGEDNRYTGNGNSQSSAGPNDNGTRVKVFDLSVQDVKDALDATASSKGWSAVGDDLFPNDKFPDGQIAFYGLSQAGAKYALGGNDLKTTCHSISCGDGFVNPPETCEPGQKNCNTTTCHYDVTVNTPASRYTDQKPKIKGTGDPGAHITVTIDGKDYTTIVDNDGDWSITTDKIPNKGNYPVDVKQTDSENNASNTSTTLKIKAVVPPSFDNTNIDVVVDGTAVTYDIKDDAHKGSYSIEYGTADYDTSNLPDGVTVTPDTTDPNKVTISIDSSYTGGDSGSFDIPYTVKDSKGNVSSIATITVNAITPPSLDDASFTVTAGKPESYDPAGDAHEHTHTVDYGELKITDNTDVPTGVTVSVVNGEINVDAPANYDDNTPFTVKYTVKDSKGNVSNEAELTITVDAQEDVSITNVDPSTTTENPRPTVHGTSEPNTTVTINLDNATLTTVPVDNSGNWSWTPNTDLATGVHPFEVVGENDSTDTTTLTIFTAPTANAGTIDAVEGASVTHGLSGDVTAGSATIDYANASIDTTNVPTDVDVSITNGAITVYVPPHYTGPKSFDLPYTVIDNDGHSAGNTLTVNIETFDVDPQNDSVDTNKNDSVSFDPTDNDGSDADASKVTITGLPDNGSVSGPDSNGNLTYTPNKDYDGTDSFNYKVCNTDETVCDTASINVTVHDFDPQDDSVSVTEDTPQTFNPTTNDGTEANPSTTTVTSGPSNGSITGPDSSSGEITYTPASGFIGTDTIIYKICSTADSSDCKSAKITLQVDEPGLRATDDDVTAVQDQDRNIPIADLTLNDGPDADDDHVTLQGADSDGILQTLNGSVEPNDAGDGFVYTPDDGYTGSDSFTYEVCNDDESECQTAEVWVQVEAAVTITGIDNDGSERPTVQGTAEPGATISIDFDGASGVTTVTADPNDGTWSWTPDNDLDLDSSYPFTATDTNPDNNSSADATLHGPATDDVAITNFDGTPLDGTETDIDTQNPQPDVSGTSEPGHELHITVTGPDGTVDDVTIDGADNNGDWSWTPDSDLPPGEYTITVEDNDNGTTDDITFTIEDEDNGGNGGNTGDEPFNPTDDTLDTDVDTTLTFNAGDLSDNDGDNADKDSVSIVGTPDADGRITTDQGGTIEETSDGTFTYTPADGFEGDDSFIYSICPNNVQDQNECAQAEVTVTVHADEGDFAITGPEDGTHTTDNQPEVTGTGEPNTTVTIVVDGDEVGTAQVDDDGNWTWTPDAPLEEGSHTIIAHDENGAQDSVSITIESDDGGLNVVVAGGRAGSCTAIGNTPATGLGILLMVFAFAFLRRRRRRWN